MATQLPTNLVVHTNKNVREEILFRKNHVKQIGDNDEKSI